MNWPCAALERADLSRRTTLRVGGQAQWLLEPATPRELQAAWVAARERELPVRLLGQGANLIIDDGLHAGAVISTERMQRAWRPLEGQHELSAELFDHEITSAALGAPERDPRVIAWCGASMPGLVRQCAQLGLSGFEGLVGVPGSIGGGIAMNAGGRWGELWNQVECVRLLDARGEFVDVRRAEHSPAYRDGRLGGRVLVAAVLRFEPGEAERVRALTDDYLRQKKDAQPLVERSAGCIFKNPPRELADGRSAGQLLDAGGAKGRRRGGAEISEKHANFLVNRGGASSADVLALIAEVRELVERASGVLLQQEVQHWSVPRPGALDRPRGALAGEWA